MSLSRLPQVALRRLVPALAAVPKSLDDDQLKKILDPQQQQQQQLGGSSLAGKGALSAKSEFASITSATQGVIAALAKSGAASTSPVLSRLLTNLSGSQGNLSLQELALLRAASSSTDSASSSALLLASSDASPLLAATPEPASPDNGLAMIDYEPTAAAAASDALDAASIDLLASALQGTAAITPASSSASFSPGRRGNSGNGAEQHADAAALEEHDSLAEAEAESDSDAMPANFAELSASERRKEQNRRAQKKFRQKDKVRQKEIKWRASQYEDLVASNKRFKHDIDAVTRERDMYRLILERNGISLLSEDDSAAAAAAAAKPARALLAAKPDVLPQSAGLSLPSSAAAGASPARTPSLASSATAASASPMLLSAEPQPSLSEMEQIAQDTFGSSLPAVPTIIGPSSLPLLSLLGGSSHFGAGVGGGGAVKADPMFGACGIPPLAAQTSQASAAFLDHSNVAACVSAAGSSLAAPQTMAGAAGTSSRLLGSTGAGAMADGNSSASIICHRSYYSSMWFGANGLGSSSSFSDPLLIESPLIVDQHSIDQSTIDSQFVDPVSFIDELLSSPEYSPSMQQASFAHSDALSFSRKRSFDEAMF
ncbi:hypothetical protein GGH99_004639, partial [Coemansia sp. RSA 1285]